jgi:hypothetical protein
MAGLTIWQILFLFAAYSAALVCLYATYRIGLERGWQWGVIHLLVLFGFVFLYWLLESWAGIRTPYYSYPPPPSGLPDVVPYFNWPTCPGKNYCTLDEPPNVRIPVSVLLLEATTTFAAMHTARLLTANSERILRPLMGAVAMLVLDFFLDPLASTSSSCVADSGMPVDGLGFWNWYVLPRLGPDAFGIPLFNYAMWYAVPIVLIALVGLFGWFYDIYFNPINVGGPPKNWVTILLDGVFLALIIWVFGVIIMMSPNFPTIPIYYLKWLFVGILFSTLLTILSALKLFNYDNDFRWWFVYPQLIFLLVALISFFGGGFVTTIPKLWIVALVVSPLFVLWTLSPYWKKIWP